MPKNNPPPATPPTPEPTPPPAPPPTTEPTPAEKTYTKAELDAEVKKAEKAAEQKVKDAEARAKLSEDERLKAERDDAINKLAERDTRDKVIAEAEKAGVTNAKLFYNAYKDELTIDEKGNITNLKEVLATAKTESAELFTPAPQPGGSADGGEGNDTQTGGLTREAIDKMSGDEIAANMDKIDAFLASTQQS